MVSENRQTQPGFLDRLNSLQSMASSLFPSPTLLSKNYTYFLNKAQVNAITARGVKVLNEFCKCVLCAPTDHKMI